GARLDGPLPASVVEPDHPVERFGAGALHQRLTGPPAPTHHGADRQRGRGLPVDHREHRHDYPAGRMMMQMVGAFAEFERAMIRERTSAGLAAPRGGGGGGGGGEKNKRKKK